MLNFKGMNEEVVGRSKCHDLGLVEILCLLMCAMASPFKSNVTYSIFLCLSIVLHT
jgi:hypothetical protein